MALPRLVASDNVSCSVIFVSVKLIFDVFSNLEYNFLGSTHILILLYVSIHYGRFFRLVEM